MENLRLKDGKFYRGAEIVPLEFGNTEQIKLIQEANRIVGLMNGDGMPIDVWVDEVKIYTVKTDFKCISCGINIYVDREVDDDDDKDYILGDCSCHKCKSKYTIKKDQDGDFVVKAKQ